MQPIEQRIKRKPLSLQQAIHAAAKRYPGGICAIATLYRFNPRTLQNKLNPTQPGCVNIAEFEAVLKCTRSTRILDAIGYIARCAWIDLGRFDEAGEKQVRDTARVLLESMAEMTSDLQEALAAGSIKPRQLESFQEAAGQLIAALHTEVAGYRP